MLRNAAGTVSTCAPVSGSTQDAQRHIVITIDSRPDALQVFQRVVFLRHGAHVVCKRRSGSNCNNETGTMQKILTSLVYVETKGNQVCVQGAAVMFHLQLKREINLLQ